MMCQRIAWKNNTSGVWLSNKYIRIDKWQVRIIQIPGFKLKRLDAVLIFGHSMRKHSYAISEQQRRRIIYSVWLAPSMFAPEID